ncbi:MAG: hypothetical protein IJP92_04245, partial [Lachnospiraceae bacterium]|nr:hypothetical protein [Lachnospiraceae bacterium]
MDKKKRKIIQLVMIVLIVGILFLCTILNVYSFRNSCVEAEADNTAVILSSITERLEYGLRYGRELDNYYDIDKVFSDVEKYCRAEEYYIFDTGLSPLYGTPPAEEMLEGLPEQIDQKQINEEHRMIWASHGKQHIVLPIHNAGGIAGYIGVSYEISQAEALTREYASRMYLYALIAALTGIVLFEILFRRTEHTDDRKVLRRLVMTTIIIVNASNSLSSYIVLNAGYEALSAEVADGLLEQSADNMERLLAAGVYYSDISDLDAYFRRVADTSAQVSTIALVREAPGDRMVRALPADGEGETRFLTAEISMPYVRAKVRTALINVIVTTITSMMIAMEILIFLVDLLVGERKNRRIRIKKDKDLTLETVGIVRGLSFCFAGFRFMAVAFMSIVLTEIYRPVTIFGYQVPYEILMSFPMSAQVFISMITSYVSGIVIYRRGWKGSAIGGVIMMCCGTLASSFASEPVSFILAQMLIGTGLGFAKMGIDVFAIVVASEKDMPEYTASSNAAIIVGYSCSASLGALIASTFGYSGAYLVMT